jgi:hypothetical protein
MILAWVISLLLVCATLIMNLERWSTLKLMHVNSIRATQEQFMKSEQSVIECEQHILNLSNLPQSHCNIQSVGKNIWMISSIERPIIQIHIHVDENSNVATRINWRQAFE